FAGAGFTPAEARRAKSRLLSTSLKVLALSAKRLASLGKAEVDLARGGVGPAARDDLAPRVEVDALGAVDVRVAEQRRLPAAKRVVGDRHRNRDVDADHAGARLELELPGGAAVTREDGDTVPVRALVHELHGLVVGPRAHEREHRAEDLVAVGVHLGRDAVEQR